MAELIDLRAKITYEADAWLDAESKATGRDRCEIVRICLHELAIRKIEELTVAHKSLKAKGFIRES